MNKFPNEPNHQVFWNHLSTNSLVRFLLLFASGWALIKILEYFEYVIFVFTVAAILALLLNYPVKYLERYLGRGIALSLVIALSLLTIIILMIVVGMAISYQLPQLFDTILQALSSSENPFQQIERFLARKRININIEPIEEQLRNALSSGVSIAVGSLPSLVSNYVTFIIILVVAFFMLIDGEQLWQLLLKLIPKRHRERFSRALQRNFLGFLQGQLLISLILSLATFIIFVALRIPFALALSLTIGAFDLIPGIGATLGVTLVGLIVLVQSGWIAALKVLFACIVLQQLQDNFIAPRVMQRTVNLNPVVVFFALLIGTKIAGLLGIFLSVPLAGVIVSLLEIEEMQANYADEEVRG